MSEQSQNDIIAKDIYDVTGRYLGCIADFRDSERGEVALLELRTPSGDHLIEVPGSVIQGYDCEFSGYVVALDGPQTSTAQTLLAPNRTFPEHGDPIP